MTLTAAVTNPELMTVQGLPEGIPRDRWQTWLEDIASIIEERIAKDFDSERGGGKALKPISDAHEQRKARDGLELDRGHMYGDLQAELDAGGFADVRVAAKTASIKFNQEELYGRAPHARYYAEQKVHGGQILTFLKRDAQAAARYLNERAAEWRAGEATRTTKGRRQGAAARRTGARVARTVLRTLFKV